MANLIDSEVLQAFSTYATIVVLKMLLMAPLTGYTRFTRKVLLIFLGNHLLQAIMI